MVISGVEIFLPLIDLTDSKAEKSRLQKELDEAQSQIKRLEGLLDSPFASKAPPAVIEKEQQKLATYRETAEKLRQQIELLK